MKHQLPIHNFSTDDEESKSIPFKLIPLERKSNYDTSVPHRHNYYEVFFFLEGSGTHFIDFENYNISTHSIHFVSPGQVHMVQRGLGSYGYVILFSRDFYYMNLKNNDILFELPFLNNNTARPILDLSETDFSGFLQLVKEMEKEFMNGGKLNEEIIRSYLNIFLVQSKRYFERYEDGYFAKDSSASSLFQRFRILLENNFSNLHKPCDYAEKLSITEKYLNEVTKNLVGKTVSEIIQERLILESKRLLLHSDLSFKEIGYFLNFEDPSYFTRFFKKNTGQTLSQFREENCKKYQS